MASLLFLNLQSCGEDPVPKPRAQLRLEYGDSSYKVIDTGCPFRFDQSEATRVEINDKCWVNLEYPELRASINMTYRPVEGNLQE